jgi:2-dehydro-3-deoxygalactonokinase
MMIEISATFLKNDPSNPGESLRAIYVDLGTTSTRVWLMRGSAILTRARKPFGVSDTARDGSNKRIRAALKESIEDVLNQTNDTYCQPACIVAAGMISSPQGLVELPHVSAPAGIRELAAGARWFEFPEITELPILLVPGVRTGPVAVTPSALAECDVMRGEETLCLGLSALGVISSESVVLNLGSHWKAIRLNAEGRIQSSITSLSGELIRAAQTQTVLAGAVSSDWPEEFDHEWLAAGMAQQRRSGLARALFCVRLLALANEGTAADRFSFLVGAFIADDLDALMAQGILTANTQVAISGNQATARAWQAALTQLSVRAVVLTAAEIEKGFLAGIGTVLSQAIATRAIEARAI